MMVVIFLTNRVAMGLLKFKDVPTVLKEDVKKELENAGLGFLAE